MTRFGWGSLSLLASFLAGFACEGRDIVVFAPIQAGAGGSAGSAGMAPAGAGGSSAGSPSGGSDGGNAAIGGDGGETAVACQNTPDCDPSWYCAKQSCADLQGFCSPRPIAADPQLLPVCGCENNITYWNDTLRQWYGISASTPGACGLGARPCMTGDDCSPDGNGSCSHQLMDFSACVMPGFGQCWIIPNDCASADDKPAWLPCPPPTPPGQLPPPPPCLTTCQVLQADWPYVRARKGDHCQ